MINKIIIIRNKINKKQIVVNWLCKKQTHHKHTINEYRKSTLYLPQTTFSE